MNIITAFIQAQGPNPECPVFESKILTLVYNEIKRRHQLSMHQ